MTLWRHSLRIGCIVLLSASLCGAGDLYWTSLDFVNPYDVDVCETTIYVATQSGMFRSWGDPEQWQQVWPGEVSRVACDGSTVLFVPGREWGGPVMVSHDNLQTAQATTGLDSFMHLGVEDLDVAGNTAIVAFDHGLFRSTNGGDSFSSYSVLWESSGNYNLKAAWTDGSACAAAGTGGFTYGIWYSASCERDTFTVVAPVGGQNWLCGSGDTLISGSYYTDQTLTTGYLSSDAGVSWSAVPWYPGIVNPDFNRPFLSGSMILSSTSYDIYDPVLDDFVGYLDGLYLTDLDTLEGTDMKDGYPDTDEIWFHAIIDTPDPWLLIAENLGPWVPGYGWASYSTYSGVNDALAVTAPVAGFYDFYLCNYPGNGVFNGTLTATSGRRELMGEMDGLRRNTPPGGTDVEIHDSATSFDDWLDAIASIFADGFETGNTSQWSSAVP